MENETKRCPFRKREDGEYMPCYGNECMAYVEYDQPIISWSLHDKDEIKAPPVHVTACKMMPMPNYFNCAAPAITEGKNAE